MRYRGCSPHLSGQSLTPEYLRVAYALERVTLELPYQVMPWISHPLATGT